MKLPASVLAVMRPEPSSSPRPSAAGSDVEQLAAAVVAALKASDDESSKPSSSAAPPICDGVDPPSPFEL
jgi:hypothetical protein